jgi:hypothetical protein
MSQKLWVAHVTPAKTFIDKVSIDGCADVADFIKEIKKETQLSIPQNTPINLYKPDGKTEIKVGVSPAEYLEGNSDENHLIVRSIAIEKGILIYKVLTSELPPEGSPKRRKIDNLIEKSKKYLFRTDRWGCVTVIKKRTAVTFAHGEHQTLKPGMSMKIYSIEGNVEFDVKVVKTIAESDWVLLESGVDLCEDEPIWGPVVDAHRYIQLGLSARHQKESPFAISTGVICSQRPNVFGHTLGSSGANPGDSGSPCFDVSTSELIGINVGCENIPISMENDTGAQIYDKISSRYASRAHIIPVSCFQFLES